MYRNADFTCIATNYFSFRNLAFQSYDFSFVFSEGLLHSGEVCS